ncbi:MAG: IS66 family insertion sequence element accessory protein TnpA [Plesiomonas sp.]
MIADWQQSGQTQKQYCQRQNIPYHVFHYWHKQYRSSQQFQPATIPGFTAVSLPSAAGSASAALILPDGRQIIFYQPVSSDYLRSLIS